MLKDKKMLKMISLGVAVLFILGVAAIAITQSGSGLASASSATNIGVVNRQSVFQQHPDLSKIDEQMQVEVEQAKKDFNEKSANMSDKEKQDYYQQLQQRLQLKQQELIAPIQDKIDAVIKEVADSKSLTVVLDKGAVVYGGMDITDDVLKKVTGK